MQKAFQTEGTAERNAQGWKWMDEEAQHSRKEGGGLEKRKKTGETGEEVGDRSRLRSHGAWHGSPQHTRHGQ